MPIFSFSSWHWCPHLSGGSAKAIDTLAAASSTMSAAAARTITVRLITSHLLSLLSAACLPKRNRPEDLSITRSRLHHWLHPSQVPISTGQSSKPLSCEGFSLRCNSSFERERAQGGRLPLYTHLPRAFQAVEKVAVRAICAPELGLKHPKPDQNTAKTGALSP